MKTLIAIVIAATFAIGALGAIEAAAKAEWKGIDETIVNKFAEEAGRPAQDPFINTDQGDLLLFAFLVAGAAGGFVLGYYYRQLFPHEPVTKRENRING